MTRMLAACPSAELVLPQLPPQERWICNTKEKKLGASMPGAAGALKAAPKDQKRPAKGQLPS